MSTLVFGADIGNTGPAYVRLGMTTLWHGTPQADMSAGEATTMWSPG